MTTEANDDLDLGGSDPDPFAEIPSDPAVGESEGEPGTPTNPLDLSDAPDEERLGGMDPEPEPTEDPVADVLAAGEPEPEPEEAPSSGDDPFAELPSEPDPDPLDDEDPTLTDPAIAEVDPAATPEAMLGPGVAHDPPPDPEPEPEDEDDAPRSDKRRYFIIEVVDDENYRKRYEVDAYNAEAALRKSYPEIVTEPGEMKLIAVAATNWRVRTVQGKQTSGMSVSLD